APPEKPTIIHRGDIRIERIDRIGLELGTESKSRFHVEEDDPLSAVAELRRTWTMSRDAWQIRIETQMRLSCTRDLLLLQGRLRARPDAGWHQRLIASRSRKLRGPPLLTRISLRSIRATY